MKIRITFGQCLLASTLGFAVGAMGVGGKLRAERGEDGLFRLPLRSSEGVFVAFRPE